MSNTDAPFVHPRGLCESENVGPGTRVWAFAHVLSGARIGRDCNVCDHVFVENDVLIGDRVTIKCGVQVWDGITLEDDVFVGPNVTFTNDPFPRSKGYPKAFSRTIVRKGASIGGNATLLPGITIGAGAMVGAGAVVTKDVPPNAIVRGSPARVSGYLDAKGTKLTTEAAVAPAVTRGPSTGVPTGVHGVTLHRSPVAEGVEGTVVGGVFVRDVPFVPHGYHVISPGKGTDTQNAHARRTCARFMVCVQGSVSITASDGRNHEEIRLDGPHLGLYLPPLVWSERSKPSLDAVLLVFASHPDDPADWLGDEAVFRAVVAPRGTLG